MKLGAKMIGSKPVATILIGLSAAKETQELPQNILRQARSAGGKLFPGPVS